MRAALSRPLLFAAFLLPLLIAVTARPMGMPLRVGREGLLSGLALFYATLFPTLLLAFVLRHRRGTAFVLGFLLIAAGGAGRGVSGSFVLGSGSGLLAAAFALTRLGWTEAGEETLGHLGLSLPRLYFGPLLPPLGAAALSGAALAVAEFLYRAGRPG